MPRLSIRWYYLGASILVLLCGAVASWYTYQETAASLNNSLLEQATAVAYALDEHAVASLTGSSTDLTSQPYLALKERLTKIRSTNSDIRFVYLTGYRDENPFIYVDSEPATSADYSPPGQIYTEGSEAFRAPFTSGEARPRLDDIYSDRWGTWLTAITPITDARTGALIALMGMDMAAHNYYRTIFFYTGFPVGVTLFILLMLLVGYLLQRREERLLAFKAEIVSIASHEIRTPLNGIAWIAEGLLKNPGSLPAASVNDLRLIESQARELLLTVGDFLDLTALEHTTSRVLTTSTLNAATLMSDLVDRFQVALPEKALSLVIDPSITSSITIQGNPSRIKRLFANLISNAIKYSKHGGTITVGCKISTGKTIFSVHDTGIGIAPSDQAHIFDGYYRAENAQHETENGTGLGLRYVEQVALLHGGRVWVESEVNKGSTFYVELPA